MSHHVGARPVVFVSTFLAFAAAARAQSTSPPLFPGVQYPTGTNPNHVVLHDVDGDGKLDAVVANQGSSSSSISILKGNGAGAFATSATLGLQNGPFALTFSDLNSDGRDDLVSSIPSSASLSAHVGLGAGEFTLPAYFPISGTTGFLVAADFNGDSRPDLAVANLSANNVALLFNVGFGFTISSAPSPNGAPRGLAAGDLDGDGDLDVVVPGGNGSVGVLINSGTGTFVPATSVSLPCGCTPRAALLRDLTGDGAPDLVVAQSDASVAVAKNLGASGFSSATAFTVAGVDVSSVDVGDMNNDGKPDVVATASASNVVSILPGNGLGALGAPVSVKVGVSPSSTALGDLNGDRNLDIVVTNRDSHTLSSLIGNGLGSFAGGTSMAAASNATSVVAADVNGDGWADLVSGGTNIGIALGSSSGAFAAPTTLPSSGAVAVADISGDDHPDVVVVQSSSIALHVGTAGGAFLPPSQLSANSTTLSGGLAITDLNNDGKLDLVATTTITSFGNNLAVFFNVGFGFAPVTFSSATPYADGIDAGDIDGDGDRDLVVGNSSYDNQIAIVRVGAAGVLSSPAPFAAEMFPRWVRFIDFDKDGKLDVVSVNVGNLTYSLLKGDGNGGFSKSSSTNLGFTPRWLEVGDLDGNGRDDLVISSTSATNFAIAVSNGAAGFDPLLRYTFPPEPSGFEIADFNLDGRPDLAFANGSQSSVTIVRNQLPVPASVSLFGTGTPGCYGPLGLTTSVPPKIGDASFAFLVSNGPPGGAGLMLLTDVNSLAGTDPVGIGILLHVDLTLSTAILTLPLSFSPSGVGFSGLPLPNAPGLVNLTFFAQALVAEPALGPCKPSLLSLETSRAISFTFLP